MRSGVRLRSAGRIATVAALFAAIAMPVFADKADDTLRFAFQQTLDHADPYFNTLVIGGIVADEVWDGLIYRDPETGELRGNLATAWRWLDDRTLELDLRQGVRFHNGAQFDADDVVYSVNFVANPDNKIANPIVFRWVERAEKVDEHRVRIIAREPFPSALAYLASSFFVIHPHEYYASVGPQGVNERPVGTGPYRVTEHALGKYLRLERNPVYYTGGPKKAAQIEHVEIRFVPDAQTRVAEVVTGGIDLIMNVSRDQAEQLRGRVGLQVLVGGSTAIAYLQLNTREGSPVPALRDVRVRQALIHAIDRDTLVRYLLGDAAEVLHVPCHPSQFGCDANAARRYDYNPALARQLLAEAGYARGFTLEISSDRDRGETEAIMGYLRAVGIDAGLRFMATAARVTALRANRSAASYGAIASSIDVSATLSRHFRFSADDTNRDAEVRDLLVRADTSMDPAVRSAAYSAALALITERAYMVLLYAAPTYYVAGSELAFDPSADGRPRFYEMAWR